MSNIQVREATIEPKEAQKLIDYTDGKIQRTLDTDRVIQYSLDMATGNWKLNGSTIVFDEEKLVADGWHRLHACVRAGKPFKTLIVENLPPEVRSTIDDGRKRMLKDDLKMNGYANGPAIESLVRKISTWKTYQGFAYGRATKLRTSRYQLLRQFKEYEETLPPAFTIINAHRKTPANYGAATFITWLLLDVGNPPQLVHKFFSISAIGSQATQDQTIVRLADKLREGKYRGERTSVVEQIYHLIRCWNSWLTDEYIGYQKPHGGLTIPFPQPLKAEIVSNHVS